MNQRLPASCPRPGTRGWEAIYADNVARIYRLMFVKVGNRADAEDLTSQVILNALTPLRTTASVGEVRAYLLRTARTVLATHWRATMGHPITTIDLDDLDRPPRPAGASSAPPTELRRRPFPA